MFVLIFEAVPDRRIVAGGDDDGAARLFRQDTIAYYRCRRGPGAEVDLDTVTGNYLGGGRREVLRCKAGVIPDNKSAVGKSRLLEIFGNPLGAEPYIFKGEVLGDDVPPAVGAELDWVFFLNLPHPLNLAFHSAYGKYDIVPGINTPAIIRQRRRLIPWLIK